MAMRSLGTVVVATLMATAAWADEPSSPAADHANATADHAKVGMLTTQSPDQWLTSQLIGASVYNSANEKVGSISDLLLDNKGAPIAAVINVGGFLGIGGKKVAVDFKSLQFERSADGDKVIAPVSKDQVKMAAEFQPYSPPAPKPPVTANQPPLTTPAPGGMPAKPHSP